jgi:uncharacterized membrane protein
VNVKRGDWTKHPHVRSGDQLSFGERAADVMRSAFGSWAFVGGFLAFMALWMVLNSPLGPHVWDRYPWVLLNLGLSMMAGLQGALILIAAKRADRVSAEQATAHYAETSKLDELLTQNTDLTAQIAKQTCRLDDIHAGLAAITRQVTPEVNAKPQAATAVEPDIGSATRPDIIKAARTRRPGK